MDIDLLLLLRWYATGARAEERPPRRAPKQEALDLRLRDVRRVMARDLVARGRGRGASSNALELATSAYYALVEVGILPDLHHYRRQARQELDRLISRYGADTPVREILPVPALERLARELGEARPKDTDETAPQSADPSADSPLHGGDGNSGECEHSAATSSDDSSSSPSLPGSETRGCGSLDPQGAQTDSLPASREMAAAGAHAADEASVAGAIPRAPQATAAGQTAEAGTLSAPLPGEPEPDGALAQPRSPRGETARTGSGQSPAGHLYEAVARAAALDAARERDAAREVIRHLRRILMDAVGTGAQSPRVDGRRLVREIISRRASLSRARRSELDYGEIIIAVDESGSCHQTVAATYAAALAVAREIGARAAVVVHSNGLALRACDATPHWLREILRREDRGLRSYYFSARMAEASARCWSAIAARRPRLILALGDYDSHQQFSELAAGGANLLLLTYGEAAVQCPYPAVGGICDARSAARELAGVHITPELFEAARKNTPKEATS